MNDEELKAKIRVLLEPAFDTLVESAFTMAQAVVKTLPENMPAELRAKILDDTIKSNGEQLKAAFKQAVPSDFEQKLKEEMNKNGKS